MKANTDIQNLLALAKEYGAHRNHALTTVSLRAAKQGQFFADLEAGRRGITLNRRDAIMQWFSDNWPNEDLAWPTDIDRPTPTKRIASKKDAA